jgi:hypothetical protein
VLLTPDNVAEYGFHLQCYVVDKPEKVARVLEAPLLRPKGPIVARVRFGLLQRGGFAVSVKDLEAIRGVCLVVRDGHAVQLSIPLRVKVDPGNEVHLYTHFSMTRDQLSKTQLVFDEHGKHNRTFIVDLRAFIKER